MEKEKVSIGFDGDVPFVDNGEGKKVYDIPVQWLVSDIVKVRANSLKEAIQLFLDNEPRIPCGTAPEYVGDSYKMSCDSYETGDVDKISKELMDNYGIFLNSMMSYYDTEYDEGFDEI